MFCVGFLFGLYMRRACTVLICLVLRVLLSGRQTGRRVPPESTTPTPVTLYRCVQAPLRRDTTFVCACVMYFLVGQFTVYVDDGVERMSESRGEGYAWFLSLTTPLEKSQHIHPVLIGSGSVCGLLDRRGGFGARELIIYRARRQKLNV